MGCVTGRKVKRLKQRGTRRRSQHPFFSFSLVWQLAFWQNDWYPLHMGYPVERETHTRTQIQGAKLSSIANFEGIFKAGCFFFFFKSLRLTEKPSLALIRQNNSHSCFRSVCASRGLKRREDKDGKVRHSHFDNNSTAKYPSTAHTNSVFQELTKSSVCFRDAILLLRGYAWIS